MRTAILFGVAALLAACTKPNPSFCDEDTPCANGGRCNVALNACPATEDLCEVSNDCDADAPVCDLDLGVCRGCVSADEGSADCPICNEGLCESCASNGECPSSAPLCDDGACVACQPDGGGDALCSERDASMPYCAGGGCAECADDSHCPGDVAPHCDLATFECTACRADAECSSGVCDDGVACVDEASVLYVSADDPDANNGNDCTRDQPCATLDGGLERMTATRRTLLVGPGTYGDAVSLSGEDDVRIVGTGRDEVIWKASDIALNLASSDGVVIEHLSIDSADGDAIVSSQSELSLFDVRIDRASSSGIRSYGGSLRVHRSEITGNGHGGIYVSDNGTVDIVNNFIANNGYDFESLRGGVILEQVTGRFAFNTVIGNLLRNGDRASGVDCTGGDVVIDSSILHENSSVDGDAASVSGCTIRYSLVQDLASVEPALVDDTSFSADPGFMADSLHLGPASPAVDKADPDAEIDDDFDGDARSDDRADVGADERVP